MNAEQLFVSLLTLDEIIVRSEFLQHGGTVHAAPIGFIEKVHELRFFGTIEKA